MQLLHVPFNIMIGDSVVTLNTFFTLTAWQWTGVCVCVSLIVCGGDNVGGVGGASCVWEQNGTLPCLKEGVLSVHHCCVYSVLGVVSQLNYPNPRSSWLM